MGGANLRRRDDDSIELRVNGVFVMDDVETSSERLLATTVLDRGAREILVGGLGLGFTLRELLASPDVRRVLVAELEPQIAEWMRSDRISGKDLLDDPRTTLVLDDVREVVAVQPPSSLDAILLDVDNGPDFLVHDSNAAVYRREFLAECAARLRPSGSLAVWSMAESRTLLDAMEGLFSVVDVEKIPVRLQDRAEHYWICRGQKPVVG